MGCTACLSISREDLLSRYLYFSNMVELTDVINFFYTNQPEPIVGDPSEDLDADGISASVGSSQSHSSSPSWLVTTAQVT